MRLTICCCCLSFTLRCVLDDLARALRYLPCTCSSCWCLLLRVNPHTLPYTLYRSRYAYHFPSRWRFGCLTSYLGDYSQFSTRTRFALLRRFHTQVPGFFSSLSVLCSFYSMLYYWDWIPILLLFYHVSWLSLCHVSVSNSLSLCLSSILCLGSFLWNRHKSVKT